MSNTSFLSKNDSTRQYTLLVKFWLDERLFGVYNDVVDIAEQSQNDPENSNLKTLWKRCIETIKKKTVSDYKTEHEAIQSAASEDVYKLFKETVVAYLKTVYDYNVHVRFSSTTSFSRISWIVW